MAIRTALVVNFPMVREDEGMVLRAAWLARGLATMGPVELFCRARAEDVAPMAGLEGRGTFARVIPHVLSGDDYARLRRVYTEEALAICFAADDPLGALLAERHREAPFDVVVCQQVYTAKLAEAVPNVPMVLDECDVGSLAYRQAIAAYGARVGAETNSRFVTALEAVEARSRARATLVTCATDAEAETIRERAGIDTRPRIVPNGADLRGTSFRRPSARVGKEILFVAGFMWPPNIQAARFLAKEVLPRVRAVEPTAKLVLCGKDPGIGVSLLRKPEVEVTGTVPSVAPYLDRAAVYANGLFHGAGSSLKALEAWASGIPLVSTAVGVRGHPVEAGRHYLPAEDADSFARAILEVFADPRRFDEMADEGRLVAESMAWENVGRGFAQAVAEVVPGRSDVSES